MPSLKEEHTVVVPEPVTFELTRYQNLLKERDNELRAAQTEIKTLRATETLKEKALQQLKDEHDKLDEKLRNTEEVVHDKNLEMKKLTDEKKEALAAQFAAEAALRRLHASQKNDGQPPIEAILAPLEADVKMYKNKIAALLEDNKALDRLTKSKEVALLETESILRSALERASVVQDIQNHNIELRRRVKICQEENKILEKTNRQKVLEVEKLGQTIHQLEEAVLAGGASANVIRDYNRQISQLNEEKRILEREVARAKVSANRVATVVANDWKDGHDKVIPVKQWLEERKVYQAEMQRLKDKIAVTERTAKAEALVNNKLKLRLKTVEEGLRNANLRNVNVPKSPNKTRRSVRRSKKISADHCEKENSELAAIVEKLEDSEDVVSGFLYDRLQKEVISLRNICQEKDDSLTAKDDDIKVLQRKIDALSKSIEVEARKAKQEISAGLKVIVRAEKHDTTKLWSKSFLRRVTKSS